MMKKLFVLLVFMLFSCGALYAQSSSVSDSTKAEPPFGMPKKNAYYLFYSNYQNNNYQGALHFGRWILIDMPHKIKGAPTYKLSTNLDRFITIYNTFADSASSLSAKRAYVDTVNQIYNKAFKNLSKNDVNLYHWHLNRGRFYQKYKMIIDSAKAKTTAQYMKAYKIHPDSIATGDAYYLKVLLRNLIEKGTDQSKKQAKAIIKKEQKTANDTLSSYLDNERKRLFSNPQERIAYLQKKLKENPQDTTALITLRNIYHRQSNDAKVLQINKKLYKINPNYTNTISLANAAVDNDNYNKAIKYLNKAKNETKAPSKLKVIYLNLGRAYMNKNQLKSARNDARRAIHADRSWGRPYILMANIYAKEVQKCTGGGNLSKKDKAVYWLVLDYLNKAKRVDPSVTSIADNELQTYRQYTPTKEDIFFMSNWKKGKTIKINGSLKPCYAWINETTTVR